MSRAVALLEQALGFSLSLEVITERRQVSNCVGRLTRTPLVTLVSMKARLVEYEYSKAFGPTAWTDIPVETVVVGKQEGQLAFRLPPSLFGISYDEALVEYVTGYKVLPADLKAVVNEIEALLAVKLKFDTDGLGVLSRLSEESWLTIRAYKGVQ